MFAAGKRAVHAVRTGRTGTPIGERTDACARGTSARTCRRARKSPNRMGCLHREDPPVGSCSLLRQTGIFWAGSGRLSPGERGDAMAALECPQCGSRNVININLTMEDGNPVSFYSCHNCDKRWWNKDGDPIDLPTLL